MKDIKGTRERKRETEWSDRSWEGDREEEGEERGRREREGIKKILTFVCKIGQFNLGTDCMSINVYNTALGCIREV